MPYRSKFLFLESLLGKVPLLSCEVHKAHRSVNLMNIQNWKSRGNPQSAVRNGDFGLEMAFAYRQVAGVSVLPDSTTQLIGDAKFSAL